MPMYAHSFFQREELTQVGSSKWPARMTINELGTAKQIFAESEEEHSFLVLRPTGNAALDW